MIVAELLEEKRFQRITVINEKADLNRLISTVESTETPDVASYLPPNTMLITTAMVYKDDQSGLCELIHSLNRLPCAALAIKLGRFIDKLNPEVIEIADQLKFPLLQIPVDVTLGEVFHQMLAYIWDDQNTELNFALNTQKKFSELLFQGASLKAMMNNLGSVIKGSAILTDTFGDIVGTTYMSTKEQLETVKELFNKSSLYERESDTIGHYREVKQKDNVSVYPIQAVGRNPFYLYIFHSEGREQKLSTLVIEQILMVFGFYFYKDLYVNCNSIKQRESIFDILINRYKQKRWSSSQLMTLGERYGIRAAARYKVILVSMEPFVGRKFDFANLTYREERYILIYNWLCKKIEEAFHGDILLFPETVAYQYVMLIQKDYGNLDKYLAEYHDIIEKIFQLNIIFSFGNAVQELDAVDVSYNTALESYKDGEAKENADFIKYYRPKSAAELLKIISGEQVKGFCLHNLKSLAYPEDEMALELRKTLKTYLDCRRSVTETANKMFLHRNTVKYRIKKCEEILGREIFDSEFCFQLQLGLTLIENESLGL